MSSLTFVDIAGSVIQLSDTIKILGVTLNSSLTMGSRTKALYSLLNLVFATYDLLNKFVPLSWIIPWSSPLLLL